MANQPREVRYVVASLPAIRWTTCAALWAALAVSWLFPHFDIPLRSIWPFLLAAAICRTASAAAHEAWGTVPRSLPGLSLAIDAALLTGLLDITGGPFNPFIVMYAIYVWLAAATLSIRWAALVTAVSTLGFGWLVLDHVKAMGAEHHRLNDFPTHLFTMWIAAATIIELVGHYVGRASAALAARQREVDEARAQAVRSERLASLMTLAAGAAHELSTPLATIAVAARELVRTAERLPEATRVVESVKDDALLIRTEVDRCHVILDRMSGRAGDGASAAPEPLPADAIVVLAKSRLAADQGKRVRVELPTAMITPAASGAGAAQALSSLLKNAFEASDPAANVLIRVRQRDEIVCLAVHDTGTGISAEAMRSIGEPFYTTKEPGRGLGLGVFLARRFAEQAGGQLRIESGRGTTATLELPLVQAEVMHT